MAQQQISIPDKTGGVDNVLASDFNTTKATVNNNATNAEGRLTTNEGNISTNTTNIATNAGNISTNATNIDDKVDKGTTVRTLAAASNVTNADNNNVIECAGTFAVNFPNGLTDGLSVTIVNVGTGAITLTADGTIVGKSLAINTQQYSAVTVYARDTDSYLVIGDLV